MSCNATLTTLTRTDKVVAQRAADGYWPHMGYIPDGVTVTRRGDRLMRDEVTFLTCAHPGPSCISDGTKVGVHESENGEVWSDDTPGATPHDAPCPKCREDGWLGDGFAVDAGPPHPCPSCGGSGTGPLVELDYGNGKGAAGAAPCPDCGGAGERMVGFGGGTPDDPDRHEPCPKCGGEGALPPYDVADNCPNCGGDGKEWFDGPTATWLKDCPSCGGSGTAPCPDCERTDGWSATRCPSCGEYCTAPIYVDEANAFYDRRDSYAEGYDDGVKAERERTAPTDGCDGTDCRIPAAHTAPTVTDAEIAAVFALRGGPCEDEHCNCQDWVRRNIREELEAAARARQENR